MTPTHSTYNLQELKQRIQQLSVQKESPKIGLSANLQDDTLTLRDTYIKSVTHCGGVPVILPYSLNEEVITQAVAMCDAIILTGGADLHPAWLAQEPLPQIGKVNTPKDTYDLMVCYAALRLNIPVLGICRGEQVLAVALGGSLIQDIPTTYPQCLGHNQSAPIGELWHSVTLNPNTRLYDWCGKQKEIKVNSFHHQAVDAQLPSNCTLAASSPDGVIEAFDAYPAHNALGVQWHPETLAYHNIAPHDALFSGLVAEATLFQEAKAFHARHLALDSHVDTPMLFSGNEDYDLSERSGKALVDWPKMHDGGLHCVCMVAYSPQRGLTPEEHEQAYQYTRQTLKSIQELVNKHPQQAGIATTPEQVLNLRKQGRIAVLKAIENGYPLANQLERVAEFAQDGVCYITLCHNGDNYLCDSASKTNHTHGGLSPLGKQMVREMNRNGILVDVSHCGSDTIRQVVELSQAPVIASHSSCRALCDHPRNLTNNELKAIAETGGVAQMCMYQGFVHNPADQASLLHFVDHICHAVDIVGVDHVGIGTDFDGDGGVIGCADASNIIRITVELMRRGFCQESLQKIWGLNFLRAMETAQQNKG